MQISIGKQEKKTSGAKLPDLDEVKETQDE